MQRSRAARSLPDGANLASGKYARVVSDRGRAARVRSENAIERFIAGRREVLFVFLEVLLPLGGIPNL